MIALGLILFLVWVMSLVFLKITGALIHLLLLAAVGMFIYGLVTGRRITRT
jgi:uncharacterized protein DUF5670